MLINFFLLNLTTKIKKKHSPYIKLKWSLPNNYDLVAMLDILMSIILSYVQYTVKSATSFKQSPVFKGHIFLSYNENFHMN